MQGQKKLFSNEMPSKCELGRVCGSVVSMNNESDAARACLLLVNVLFFWQVTEMVWASLPLPGSKVMSHRLASLGLAVLNDMPFLDVAL